MAITIVGGGGRPQTRQDTMVAGDDEMERERNTVAARDVAMSIEVLEETIHLDEEAIDGIEIIAVESAGTQMTTTTIEDEREDTDIHPPRSAPTDADVIEMHTMMIESTSPPPPGDDGDEAHRGPVRPLNAHAAPRHAQCSVPTALFLRRTTHSHRQQSGNPPSRRWKSRSQTLVIRDAWLQRATRSISMVAR